MPFQRLVRKKSCANHPPPPSEVDPHEVARAAYALYEERGRQDGQALDDWLKAEAILQSRTRHSLD